MPHGAMTARATLRAALTALVVAVTPASLLAAEPGDFDFYVLALSWSPSYCANEGADADPRQCRGNVRRSFVLHGLWPQYERGYPESCPSEFALRVPDRLARSMLDIMPSPGLVGYQWRKHGTCTGLDQAGYFQAAREAYSRVRVPDAFLNLGDDATTSAKAIEAAFVAANPGLSPAGIAVACKGGRMAEIRICLTDALEFRRCGEVDAAGCRSADIDIPAP
jgi:ribonuclease T2